MIEHPEDYEATLPCPAKNNCSKAVLDGFPGTYCGVDIPAKEPTENISCTPLYKPRIIWYNIRVESR